MKPKLPPPPKKLSREARALWTSFVAEYDFEPAALATLETALQAWDRWRQAQAILDAEGVVIVDRFDQPKPHPAALIERDSRRAFQVAMKQLGLDLPPAPEPIRRPRDRS